MEHYFQNVPGYCSYAYLYVEMVNLAEDGDLFVEIGSFKGQSASCMGVEIINSGKAIKFDAIDTWEGSEEHQAGGECEDPNVVAGTLFEEFIKNIEPVKSVVNPVRMFSTEAYKQYEDKSISFIMIDGDHSYEGVKADVLNFYPKMKPGGFMTGDDAWSPDVWRGAVDAIRSIDPTLTVQLINNIHFYIEIPEVVDTENK